MTRTHQILADIERHGVLTAAAIHKIRIDTLIVMQKQGEKT